MSVDPQTLQLLATHLDNTLSTDTAARNKATDEIRALEARPGSSLLLLTLITTTSFPPQTRQAAAITFKNFILQHWDDDPTPSSLLPPSDRATIKAHLVSLMLSSPPSIQQQLSQVLAIISKSDFPSQWQSLLPDLTATLLAPASSHSTIMGCLSTLHSIFFRYRHEYRSDALFREILYVLELFAPQLTSLFTSTISAIFSAPSSPTVPELFERLALILEIFLSLNSQDIPEYFEDHMTDWFRPFQQLLPFSSPAVPGSVDGSDDAEESIVDRCKALVCEIVNLYALRYEDPFSSWVSSFVELIWQLLSRLSSSAQYDHLVSTSIRFLTSVISKPWNKALFASPSALSTITQQIIIPQIKLRPSDIATFHSDPVEWVRRDIEGSDVDTRRRVTVDFIRGLLVSFEPELTELMKGYTAGLIQAYADSRGERWLDKDAAIYIILALSSKGVTKSKGITKTNPYIDLGSFFSSQILSELQPGPPDSGGGADRTKPGSSPQPILQADAIRFIAAFRSQLSAQQLLTILPILITHIRSPHYVVHTYAAYAVEKILTVRSDSGAYVISKADFAPFAQAALMAPFGTMAEHEDSRENEYLMRCVLRVVSLVDDGVLPITQLLIDKLTAILGIISLNPTHPDFNHAVFDTYAALIVNVCKAQPQSVNAFERALFPVFESVLKSETAAEFSPYIFQILALLLERRPDVSPQYRAVYPSLLYGSLYDNAGNIPALVRLLSAYLYKHKAAPLASPLEQLTSVLGLFQKLLSNRKQHLLAVDLLVAIVDCLSWAQLEPYTTELWRVLFVKLQSKPGTAFLGRIVLFFCVFVLRHGGSRLVQSMDALQPGVSRMVVENVILNNLAAVVLPNDRRTVAVGLTDLLTSGALLSPENAPVLLPRLVTELVQFVSSGTVLITEVDADADVDETEAPGVRGDQSVFSRLAHATAQPVAYTAVADSKAYLAAGLRQLGGKVGGLAALVSGITDATSKKQVEEFIINNAIMP